MNKPLPEGISMTQHSHQTAPTHYVEARGIRFAYRRFGRANGVPLTMETLYESTTALSSEAGRPWPWSFTTQTWFSNSRRRSAQGPIWRVT
jgi:hypothetical protein